MYVHDRPTCVAAPYKSDDAEAAVGLVFGILSDDVSLINILSVGISKQ